MNEMTCLFVGLLGAILGVVIPLKELERSSFEEVIDSDPTFFAKCS